MAPPFQVTPFAIGLDLFFYNLFAERSKGKSGHFEMLFAERNSDDGNAKEYAKPKVGETDPNAAQNNPKNVHDKAQTSARLWRGFHALTERAEAKDTYLQGLDTKRNTDDGDHHTYTGYDVFYGGY